MSEPVRNEPVMETITMKGVAMSRLGFGAFRRPGAAAQSVVASALALALGYRHIDTAAMYENERHAAPIRFLLNLRGSSSICVTCCPSVTSWLRAKPSAFQGHPARGDQRAASAA
jgi:predicted aldo/keto reductase-like oxidoreductase